MIIDTVYDEEIFLKEYYRKKPCKCAWTPKFQPSGWQDILTQVETEMRAESAKLIATKQGGYVLTNYEVNPWVESTVKYFNKYKPADEYIIGDIFISLFGFSTLFGKHQDIDHNVFVIGGEGEALWQIDGYEDFTVGPDEVLYLLGDIPHYARSLGPRYSISISIESEESRFRDNTDGDLIKNNG